MHPLSLQRLVRCCCCCVLLSMVDLSLYHCSLCLLLLLLLLMLLLILLVTIPCWHVLLRDSPHGCWCQYWIHALLLTMHLSLWHAECNALWQ